MEAASSAANIPLVVLHPETDIFLLANDLVIKLIRLGSFLFNTETTTATDGRGAEKWFFTSERHKFQSICDITSAVSTIFANEERVVEVSEK